MSEYIWIKKDSLVSGMSSQDYHSRTRALHPVNPDSVPYILSSSAVRGSQSPFQWRYKIEHPDGPKKGQDLGRLVHALVLQGMDAVDKEFIVKPETYTDEKGIEKKWHGGANICKAWEESAAKSGKTLMSQADMAIANNILELCAKEPEIDKVLSSPGSHSELAGFWVDKEFAVWRKVMWDRIWPEKRIIVDLKTTGSAGPDFGREASAKYLTQAAFYIEAAERFWGGEWEWAFGFITFETSAPYMCGIHWLPSDAIAAGRKIIRKKISAIANAIKTNDFGTRLCYNGEMLVSNWALNIGDELEAIYD